MTKSPRPQTSRPQTGFAEPATSYGGFKIADAFAAAGSPPPYVIWQPHPGLVESRSIKAFQDICDKLSGCEDTIAAEDLDLASFGSMKDWLMLLEPCDDGAAYRYVHYGKGIARVYGNDMTGKTTKDFPGHISKFFTAIYNASRQRKERVLTVHQPPDQVFVTTWRRLIVPVVDASGEVVRILALNSPENELRAGLEILPVSVLIVDADRIVRYANKVARQTFDEGNYGPWLRTVFDYAALELDIRERPDDILSRGIAQTCTCRHIKHQWMGQYHATVSAARHKGTAFYVVLLQPMN